MFYVTYLHRELRRRLGRTVLIVLGLAASASLIVVASGVSTGLDRAQRTTLNPLAEVGADLVVSRIVEVPLAGTGGANPTLVGGVSDTDVNALVDENPPLFQTDFSTIGAPGSNFNREVFLPATHLTFPQNEVQKIARLKHVDRVAGALSLLVMHQKGTVPRVPATGQAGARRTPTANDSPPPTPAEWKAINQCIASSGGGPACLPARLKQMSSVFTTPREVVKQVLNPPQTDLTNKPYTAAGVDARKHGLGLITAAQVVKGRFLNTNENDAAVLGQDFANRQKINVGDTFVVAGSKYRVVGVARPPLGGQSADVYMPLRALQTVSGRPDRINTLLVRADHASDVPALTTAIERAFPGASVTTAKDASESISGSLVSAHTAATRGALAVAAVAILLAVTVAVLLTLSSVAKRGRDLGTLAALGWSRGLIARQLIGECFAQGALGGLIGTALGALLAFALTASSLSLHATGEGQAGPLSSSFGLGKVLANKASETIRVTAPLKPTILVLALTLAIAGGLVAGGAGALRASRLRAGTALREVG
ncbi:MAG: hypothetical protein QOJ00_2699 [Actinomycetota bacterium]|jgi:ABC-type lipoprotein release transport system permease subunit